MKLSGLAYDFRDHLKKEAYNISRSKENPYARRKDFLVRSFRRFNPSSISFENETYPEDLFLLFSFLKNLSKKDSHEEVMFDAKGMQTEINKAFNEALKELNKQSYIKNQLSIFK